MRLAGKIALVTGGASGFGAGIARTFAREGAKVAILDLNDAGAKEVASSIGANARAIQGDVTAARDVAAAVENVVAAHGRLDIVVNNAGSTHRNQPMLNVSEAEFDRVFAVNVKSIFHMAHAAIPVMRRQGGGTIINIGSTAGIRPRPGLAWYNATKGAVNLLSRSMAVELATRRRCGRNSWPRSRWEGCRGLTMSPTPASISPPTRPRSSPAWCWRSTAAARFEREILRSPRPPLPAPGSYLARGILRPLSPCGRGWLVASVSKQRAG